jgi:phosphoglycerate dehydrogenase-like enzyme
MNIESWQARVEAREVVVGVVGLGYVGLPVACEFARAGFRVVGVDVQAAPALVDARGFCDRRVMESYGWHWTGLGVAPSDDA